MAIRRCCLLVISLCLTWPLLTASAQQASQGPTYQRHSSSWRPEHDRRRRHDWRHDRFRPQQQPQVSSGWFQRPYPYHLDYYKMRFGGSYAPYFGNLYGPPVVIAQPGFFGGFGFTGGIWPQFGSFGFPQDGFGGAPWGGRFNNAMPFNNSVPFGAPVEGPFE